MEWESFKREARKLRRLVRMGVIGEMERLTRLTWLFAANHRLIRRERDKARFATMA